MTWTVEIPDSELLTEDRASTYPTVDGGFGGLAELSESYRQLGFEAGYAQAARDQLEASVVIAEQILRERSSSLSGPQEARRLLYSFIARVDRRLSLYANPTPSDQQEQQDGKNENCASVFVEGGLGI
jgi:hypothetical protein